MKKVTKMIPILVTLMILSINISVFATEAEWPGAKKTIIDTTADTVSDTDDSVTSTDSKIQNNSEATSGTINATDSRVDGDEGKSVMQEHNETFYNADSESKRLYASYADTLPTVSIDDWINWVNRKGYEVITFFQVIVQPFTMLIFIISAFLTLVGTIGRGDLAGKGMWGMIMSAIIYAAVLYAPVILNSFVGWMST